MDGWMDKEWVDGGTCDMIIQPSENLIFWRLIEVESR